MKNVTEVYFDPSLCGHCLVRPGQWYGRQVESLFKAPVPPESWTGCEITARVITAIVLLVIIPIAVLFGVAALVGLGVKCCAAKWQNPPSPDQPIVSPPPAPTPADSQPSDEEVPVQKIWGEVTALLNQYNHFTQLNTKGVKGLSKAVEEFQIHYGRYRASNEALEKAFLLFDEIESNVRGMERFLDRLKDYEALLRLKADEQGIVWRPADGSCWLHVIYLGLQHCNHPRAKAYEGNQGTAKLRAEVVDAMEAKYRQEPRDEDFHAYLSDAIRDCVGLEKERLHMEQASLLAILASDPEANCQQRLEEISKDLEAWEHLTPEGYFAHMRQSSSWGGLLEFYTISQMFDVNIVVWQKVGRGLERKAVFSIAGNQTPAIHAVFDSGHYNYRLPDKLAPEEPCLVT